MRFLVILFCLFAAQAVAQVPVPVINKAPEPIPAQPPADESLSETPAPAVTDWKKLGTPMGEDETPMVNRYVYFNTVATAKNIPLNQPVMSPAEISDVIKTMLGQAMTMTGKNYDQKLIQNQSLFTPTGYGEYVLYLQNANMSKFLKDNAFKVNAYVEGTPEITAQGLRDVPGAIPSAAPTTVYVWQASATVIFSYLDYKNEPPADLFPDKKQAAIANRFPVTAKIELIRIPMKDDETLVAINRIGFVSIAPAAAQ